VLVDEVVGVVLEDFIEVDPNGNGLLLLLLLLLLSLPILLILSSFVE